MKRKIDYTNFDDVLQSVCKKSKNIYLASKELQNNKDILLIIVKYNSCGYKYVPEHLKYDKDIILEVIKKNNNQYKNIYKNLPDNLKADKQIILEVIKINIELLYYAPFVIINDYDIIMEAININPFNGLKYASEQLKDNYDIVLKAVEKNGYALQFASNKLKDNFNIVYTALTKGKSSKCCFKYASNKLKGNKDIVHVAILEHYSNLKYASYQIKNDSEFILKNFKNLRYNIINVSFKLKNNYNFIMEVIKQNGHNILYTSSDLKNNKEIILEALNTDYIYYNHASNELKNDIDIILKALSKANNDRYYNNFINSISPIIYNNKDYVLKILKHKYPLCFNKLSINFRNDREIMLEAVKVNGENLKFVSNNLIKDSQIILEAIKNNYNAFNYLSDVFKYNKNNFFILLKHNCLIINCVSNIFINYKNNIFKIIFILIKFHNDKVIDIYNIMITKLSDDNKIYIKNIIDIQYYNIYNIEFIKENNKILNKYINFKLVINHIYDINNYEILLLNRKILNYISENPILFPKFIEYLFLKEEYDMIYEYENFNDYIKEKFNIIIKSISDINIDYNNDELKDEIEERCKPYKIKWIN